MSNWIDGLKPGDSVVVSSGAADQDRLEKITAVQNLHVVIGSSKYRKRDGRDIYSSALNKARILKPTPERVTQIEAALDKRNAVRRYRIARDGITPTLLTVDQLDSLTTAYEALKP